MHFRRNHDDRQTIMVEKIQNVCGSTAGAGSGEFHNYRRQRRKVSKFSQKIYVKLGTSKINDNGTRG